MRKSFAGLVTANSCGGKNGSRDLAVRYVGPSLSNRGILRLKPESGSEVESPARDPDNLKPISKKMNGERPTRRVVKRKRIFRVRIRPGLALYGIEFGRCVTMLAASLQ